MKLLIVRHADPDYSIDSLTETGWIEAELLSQRLTKLDVNAFYCSPFGRARDTSTATLTKLNRTAEIMPWLREFSPGMKNPSTGGNCAWDWLPQTWTQEPKFYDKDRWTDTAFRDTGIRDQEKWVAEGLDELLTRHGYVREGNFYRAQQANDDTIVLFCHFGVECVLLGHLLGISPMVLWHGTCAAPSSVTTLVTEERREGIACFRMSAFGDTSHLYVADRKPSFSARFCEMYTNEHERHD